MAPSAGSSTESASAEPVVEAAAGAEFRCGRKIGAEVKTPEQGREQVLLGCSFGNSGPGQSLGYKVLVAFLVFQNNGIVSPAIICGSQDHTIFLPSMPLSLSLGLHALTTGHTVFRPSSVARPFTSRHHSVGLLLSPWIAEGFRLPFFDITDHTELSSMVLGRG